MSTLLSTRCTSSPGPISALRKPCYTIVSSSVTSSATWAMKDIPGPGGLPYFGSWFKYKFDPSLRDKFHEHLISMRNLHGNIFKETISGQTTVHLFDPEDFSAVYTHAQKLPRNASLMIPSKYYRIKRKLGLGIGNLNGEDWYKIRSAVQPVMLRYQTSGIFFPLVSEVVDDFISRIKNIVNKDGRIDQFESELFRWNFESGFNMFMGTRLRCLEDDRDPRYQAVIDVNTRVLEVTKSLSYSLGAYHYIPTPLWLEHVRVEDMYYRFADEILQKSLSRLRDPTFDNSKFPFLMYLLGQPEITQEHLKTIAISSTFDGLNATVPTIAGQLYCLATNPDKQQRLYEAIMDVIPDRNTPLTFEHLQKISYLKHCFKEGFRFFPIGTEITRVPVKDIFIRGYRIPAGTRVDVHTTALLKDPTYFSQPEAYIPERWSRDQKQHVDPINPYATIPFGFGTRMCIGRRFAELDMHVLTVELIRNFRIEWPHRTHMKQIHKTLLVPDTYPDFNFIRRECE